jgi:hypothetical protein
LNKNSLDKKYQIRSFDEYYKLKEFCKTLDAKGYEFLWCHDGNEVKTNQLYKIIEGNYFCCKDCDRPMKFISRPVLVKYGYFHKKNDFK